jgi:uncharacterized protein
MGGAPARTCAGCRERDAKARLLRLVRTPGGVVRVDGGGSSPGRGAYVHRRADCVAALGRGGLVRALRTGLTREELGRLTSEIEREMEAS